MKRYWYKLWRCVLADMMYKLAGKDTIKKINDDAARYMAEEPDVKKNKKGLSAVNCLLLTGNRTFRSVFYYRLKKFGKLCSLCNLFLPAIKAVEIYGKIDGGLYLSHYHMVVHTNKAGKNLTVGPGVVLGKNNGNFPTFGDNVCIGANSTVIGDITIGDNAVILAGSVVTKSLPGNAVYSGNPAHCVSELKTADVEAV